jgi:energy-coupling factor transporter ATP-binding protein EcfA2
MTISSILAQVTIDNWPELAPILFEKLVEKGASDGSLDSAFSEVAQRIGASKKSIFAEWKKYLALGEEIEGRNATKRLLALAEKEVASLWHTPSGESWATVQQNGIAVHWPIRSREFRLFLVRGYEARLGAVPYPQALVAATTALEARALYEGEERPVATRIGQSEGRVYLDLARPDGQVVVISPEGWEVTDSQQCPVAFYRSRHTLPLPIPKRPGTLEGLLKVLPIGQDLEKLALTLAWLVGCLNPRGPYPLLVLGGEKGAGKSSAARFLKGLLDPTEGTLRAAPRQPEDLAIAARGSHVLALDNVSSLPSWLSDSLCLLATGGALSKRELYTDREEVLLEAKRPVILTGIGLVGLQDDLNDRLIRLELERLPRYLAERHLERAFEAARPEALAALLDGVAMALRDFEAMADQLSGQLPRMADWLAWVEAAAPALGLERGEILELYQQALGRLDQEIVELHPVARTLRDLAQTLEAPREYTVGDLLEALRERAGLDDRRTPTGWPGTPQALARTLPRLQAALRAVGVQLAPRRDQHSKRQVWVLGKQ